ncbi:MAG: CpaF family protein [Burkholderiales bacterium]|nr:CpaF family protein [Burkholderiales bacterium]
MAQERTPQDPGVALRDNLRRSQHQHTSLIAERMRSLAKPAMEGRLLREDPVQASSTGYDQVRQRLHRALVDVLNPQAVANASLGQIEVAVDDYLAVTLDAEAIPLSRIERLRLRSDLIYELIGLGPLAPLMADATVADILVNGPHLVYVERHGVLEATDVRFHDNEHLMLTIERILSRVGRRVDEGSPMADARLPDGSRVNVIIPPLAIDGPVVSIRRFMRDILRLEELVERGSVPPRAAEFLRAAVEAKLNIVVSGATGSGKTTMLNCLSHFIGEDERVLTIEDTAELILHHRHLVRMEGRPANTEGKGNVSIRDLVRNALRMRPDRIIVGEARGAEALDMLQAMNTGHDGSLTTLHSNSPRDTLSRLETMMLMADVDLPQRVLREQIASAIQLIVHLNRYEGGQRRVAFITEITGTDNGVVLMQDLFVTRREGGQLLTRPTGIVSAHAERFYERDVALDPELFRGA